MRKEEAGCFRKDLDSTISVRIIPTAPFFGVGALVAVEISIELLKNGPRRAGGARGGDFRAFWKGCLRYLLGFSYQYTGKILAPVYWENGSRQNAVQETSPRNVIYLTKRVKSQNVPRNFPKKRDILDKRVKPKYSKKIPKETSCTKWSKVKTFQQVSPRTVIHLKKGSKSPHIPRDFPKKRDILDQTIKAKTFQENSPRNIRSTSWRTSQAHQTKITSEKFPPRINKSPAVYSILLRCRVVMSTSVFSLLFPLPVRHVLHQSRLARCLPPGPRQSPSPRRFPLRLKPVVYVCIM